MGTNNRHLAAGRVRRGLYVLLRAFTQNDLPRLLVKAVAKTGVLPVRQQYELGVVGRPWYAYGLMSAAAEARALGYSSMTAIEFGVGAGNGLLWMEEHARNVTALTGVSVAVFGFDTGVGLPEPLDHRDLPAIYSRGFYPMDEARLRGKLGSAELILGDVRDTVPAFLADRHQALAAAPLAFVSFDLDYWSSTTAAFDVFRAEEPGVCLPRVTCYFDDITFTVEDVGELRAIRDFNQEEHGRKVRAPQGLRSHIPFQPYWAEKIFKCHLFDHPEYASPKGGPGAGRIELEQRWS